MTDDYSKKIEQYFNNVLDEAERTAFNQQLEEDAELAKSFAQRKQMEDFLAVRPGREQLKAEIAELSDAFFPASVEPTAKKILIRRRLYWIAGAAAAALLLLLFVPTWLNAPPKYQQFADHRPLSMQERGTGEEQLQQIETTFNAGDYASALPLLEQHLQAQPDDQQAQIYAGIAALELDQIDKAIALLSPVSASPSIYKSTAQWYLALTYLKQKDYGQSQAALSTIPADNYWYAKAQALLKKLPQE